MTAVTSLEQFEPWELEAFAEGADIPQLAIFAQQHPGVWSIWLEGYRRQQQKYAQFHRFDCPSPDALRDYYWDVLTSEQRAQIASHLTICGSCTDELRTLEESLTEDNLPVGQKTGSPILAYWREQVETLADHIKWTVATLVSPLTPTLAPVALRSAESTPLLDSAQPTTLLFETADLDLNLILQKENDSTITLGGQILTALPLVDAQVNVTEAASASASVRVLVNKVGEFATNGLRPGTYQLRLNFTHQATNHVITIPNLILK